MLCITSLEVYTSLFHLRQTVDYCLLKVSSSNYYYTTIDIEARKINNYLLSSMYAFFGGRSEKMSKTLEVIKGKGKRN